MNIKMAKPSAWMCGDKLDAPMKHHESVQALWEHEWKRKCSLRIYPFHFCRVEDMEAIINELAEKNIHDAYDDAWTATFLPHLHRFESEGRRAEAEGDYKAAEDWYLRGATIGMISRFPMINSPLKREAWSIQKRLYLSGTSFWASPVHNVYIPHTHTSTSAGDGATLQFFLRRPPISAAPPSTSGSPVLIVWTGLDGYRTDHVPAMAHYAVSLGYAVVYMEIPGTGDAPGAPNDPASADRQLDTLLDWIEVQGGLDARRVCLWGTSTGGYYALRNAHTHHERIGLAIAQGAPADRAFERDWLDRVDNGEYSFPITPALMHKFGYESVEKMKEDARDRFSLVKTGIFDGPCTRLLATNGVDDTIFPIEDTIVAAMHGSPKEVRIVPNRPHMGEPQSAVFIKEAFEKFVKGV